MGKFNNLVVPLFLGGLMSWTGVDSWNNPTRPIENQRVKAKRKIDKKKKRKNRISRNSRRKNKKRK